MRLLYSFIATVLFSSVLSAAPIDSACYIKVLYPDSTYSAGSGTVIACEEDYSLILTCAHVVLMGEGKITIWIQDKTYDATYLVGGKASEVKDEKGNYELKVEGPDLALLTVKAKLKPALLANSKAKVGDRVRQWGFAGGSTQFGYLYKEGKVIEDDELTSTADARRGDSGCALFNNNDEIVGVVNSRPANPDLPIGFAMAVDEVKKSLKGFDKLDKFPQFVKKLKGE